MFPEILQLPAADAWEHRRLTVFLAASVALHAFLIVTLPEGARPAMPPLAGPLEVTLLPSQALPAVAAPEPLPVEPQPSPAPRPEQNAVRADASAPGLVAPQPDRPEGSFSVAPLRLPEAAPVAVDPKVLAANAAAASPNFEAKYLNNPAPAYPPAARRAGEQGTVMLRVLVKRDGLPLNVEIEKSSGSQRLDAAARDAVWGWRFVPALQGTDPIEASVRVPVVFRLDGPG